jgi:hypothetical protein
MKKSPFITVTATATVTVAFAAVFSLVTPPGQAEGASCQNWSDFPAFDYAQVISAKASFFDDNLKERKAYLVKGDVVAVRNVKTDYACALYISAKGTETIGWLKVTALKDTKVAANYAGTWRWAKTGAAAMLTIKQSGVKLSISGQASTPNGGGSVNVGEIGGTAIVDKNSWLFSDSNCDFIGLWLNGFLSVVQKGSDCVGINVTFTGVYRR